MSPLFSHFLRDRQSLFPHSSFDGKTPFLDFPREKSTFHLRYIPHTKNSLKSPRVALKAFVLESWGVFNFYAFWQLHPTKLGEFS